MTGLALLQHHPLACKVIKDWFYSKMIESLKDESITEEFKQYMIDQGVEDDKVGILIDANPRMLFDVYDANEIFIEIYTSNIPLKWTAMINRNAFSDVRDYNNRKEAEIAAIEEAFKLLEEKLTPKLEEHDN